MPTNNNDNGLNSSKNRVNITTDDHDPLTYLVKHLARLAAQEDYDRFYNEHMKCQASPDEEI